MEDEEYRTLRTNSKPIDVDFFANLISKEGVKNEVTGPTKEQKWELHRQELQRKRQEEKEQREAEYEAEEEARARLPVAKA